MKLGREVTEYLKTMFVARQGKSTISDHLTPTADETVNLGSSSYKWDTIYARNVVATYLTGEGGDADMVDGFHAYAAPNPNALLALNSSSKYPGTTVQTGVALTVSGNDLILAFSGNPTTIEPDDTAAGGSSSYAARTDHKHAIVADAPTGSLADDTGNTEGSATSFARSDHLHAITASFNPGATAELLKTASDGGIQLTRLGIGVDPGYDNWVQMVANGQIGYYGGPNIRFDNANSELEVLFGSNQRACFYDEGGLFISPTDTMSNVYGFEYYANGDISSPASRAGFTALVYHNAGTAASTLYGLDAIVRAGTDTGASISNAYGIFSEARAEGGDITSGYGGKFRVTSPSASSLIGTAYGINIEIDKSTGAITLAYGLKIEDLNATTNYSIYTGTGLVSLGAGLELRGSPAEITTLSNADIEIKPNGSGFVSIGAANPSRMLDVIADATQLRLTYASDTAKYAEFTVGSTGTVEWDAVANIVLDPGGNNVNPGGSIEDDLGAYNVKWRTLYAAEMYVENLVAQDVMATIGGRIMVAPTTKLDEDLDTVETGVDVEDASAFAANDYIYLCSAPGDPPVPQVEVMQIQSIASNTLTVVRNKDGSGANSWLRGDAVVNLGYAAGEGYLELTSTQTIHSHLGPTVAIYARTGATNWNDVNPIVALGNLDSFLGYGTVYGLAIGNDLELSSPASASFQGATITQADGLKLYNTDITLYDTTTPKVQVVHDEGILLSSGTWGTDTTSFAAVFADDTTVADLDAGDVIIGTPFHSVTANKVGIHWDNSTGTLKILGSVLVGAGYGVVVPDAVLYSPFDGPWPYSKDFQVDVNSHLGAVGSLSGAVIGREGKFGKALQVAEATTNQLNNPSWEVDTNFWSNIGYDSYLRQSTLDAPFGDYYARLFDTSATGGEYLYSNDLAASEGQTWAFSVYIYKTVENQASTGTILLHWLTGAYGHIGYTQLTLDAGDHNWKCYRVVGTAPAGTGLVRAEIWTTGIVSTTDVYFYLDGAQLEQKAYSTPYCDGSLGIGHTWSGTAHGSSSSRTAGQLVYADVAIPNYASISVWVYSTAKISQNGNKRVILSAYDTNGIALYIDTSDQLTSKVSGQALTYSLTDGNFPVDTWHHIAVTWNMDSWELYLDGAEVNQTSTVSVATDDGGGYDIGHEGGSYQWPGFIDDLIVTEHYLTSTEVTVLYDSQLPAYVRTNKYELMLTDIGHGKVLGSADGLFGWDSAGNEAFALVTAGVTWGSKSLSEGDLLLGDPDGSSYLWYDCSEQKLFVQGGIYVGDFNGCVIDNAIIHLPFDGPRPYEIDYQVNTTGHLGQKPTESGGVIGRPGKFDKAVQTAEATTNLVINPSAEVNTTGWNASGSLYLFERVTTDGVIGTCCFHIAEVSAGGAAEYVISDFITASASTIYTVSLWVKQVGYDPDDYGDVTVLFYDNTPTMLDSFTLNFDEGDFDWKHFQETGTSPSGTTQCRVRVNLKVDAGDAADLYFDGVQLEQKDYCTPYCDGSLGAGHTWSGTAHASSSTRTVAKLKYLNAGIPAHGSVSFWVASPDKRSLDDSAKFLFDYGSTNGVSLWISTTDYVRGRVGGNSSDFIQLTDSNFVPGTWYHFVLTWDKNAGEFKFYKDGVKVGSTGTYGTWNPSDDVLHIGESTGESFTFPGWFDDLLIVDYVFTENDVRRIYESGISLIVPTNKFELMLTEPGAGKLIGHAGGIFGYDVSGNEAFALTTGAVTWGGQAMAAGDMILGDPDNNAHLFYDASAGQLLFRDSSKVTQVYLDTDGTFKACGGDIVLSDGDMEIWDRSASEGTAPSIDFWYDKDPGNAWIGYVMGDYGGTTASLWLNSVRYTGAPWSMCNVIISAYDDINSYDPRITLNSDKTCYYSSITDVFMDGNIDVDGNVLYEGVLISQKNSTDYTVYGATLFNEPQTSTSWDGDAKTVGSYDIDTSASPWSLPIGVEACYIRIAAKWAAASDSSTCSAKRKGGTADMVVTRGDRAGIHDDAIGWVTCDSNGDFTIVVAGADTTSTFLQIWGYMI